jgi:hypothetical protein
MVSKPRKPQHDSSSLKLAWKGKLKTNMEGNNMKGGLK